MTKQPCLSTEAGIYSFPEASFSLPFEYLKHFQQSTPSTGGAARAHKQARYKTVFVSQEMGAGQLEKQSKALLSSFPSWFATESHMPNFDKISNKRKDFLKV